MMNKVIVSRYFSDLASIITENGLTPDVIWNCDETGKQFEHRPTSIIARKGTRSLPGRTGNSRENITILASVNACGTKIPPMCVVKGKTMKSVQSSSTLDAPQGTMWTYQERAWMCDILGTLWFKDVFLRNIGPKRPQLLIMDSHGSHEVLGLIEEAVKENIILLALPPHTSHHLQPLDKSVFGPFAKAYDKACSQFMSEDPNHIVNKATWPRLFKSAWETSVTPQNIISGFRATGIWPLNPKIIPESAYSPAEAFEVPFSSTCDVPLEGVHNDTHEIDATNACLPEGTNTPVDNTENCTSVSNPKVSQSTSDNLEMESPDESFVRENLLDSSLEMLAEAAVSVSMNATTTSSEAFEIPTADVPCLLEALSNGAYTLSDLEGDIATSMDWNSEVEALFAISQAAVKKTTSRAVTSHRILTSEDVLNEKRAKEAEKERKEKVRIE
ncbi:hypothetical protein FSP39_024691 [Pinctada imbricata]|uniref:DDE-1 domain-containing protein n=1 Tax=Pinctada imbricata TaxID=66713 RepID=A0AA88YFR3_PINIB|nr:hypothetical protein FSP39_024691 [Pinctada imbricata]